MIATDQKSVHARCDAAYEVLRRMAEDGGRAELILLVMAQIAAIAALAEGSELTKGEKIAIEISTRRLLIAVR